MNTILNFCQNKDQAKLVCPNFCGLCDLVDGNWADWSIWSGCDVTCGSGTQSRDRTCTNPAPEHGGLDCIGSNTETKACIMIPCPIHGGWSLWSPWGSCSVTCDVGIQRRDRSCSNPYPALNGDHCFGESRDDRICQETACANGGWSSWETWSSCGVTCGGGRITRQRYCNNPPPSLLGNDCRGKGEEYTLCNTHACTNHVAFSAQLSARYTTEASVIVFDVIKLNEGQAYNPHTGIFTAPFNGMYTFAVYILEDNPRTVSDWADFYLRKNDDHEPIGAVDISFSDNSNALFLPGGITVVENLNRGDRIFVTCIAKGKFVHGGPFSKFSGYLIAEN
ncbi:hemicentin-1-like [Mya arenaria]|uniref:hemicentin-1-like n=1 Tax=Mya arenaria TaxID=6604 RepID=UPI0022E835FF|nr:hemicentin-1-like [Mya arenaria]